MKLALALLMTLPLFAQPVPLIFDTDIGNDIDDALALAVIHALESRGEVKLLGVTITKDNPHAAPFVDAVNHFYQRPNIPVGAIRNGPTPEDSKYLQLPADRYPRRIQSGDQAEEPTALLERVLKAQADHSVVIVQVGFSTNLARFLKAPGARDLIQRKVRLLSVMAGHFPAGKPEYNVRVDIASARTVFGEWPTPIVFSGYEIGESIKYPARSIEEDYRYVTNHPIAEAYRLYMTMPYDRPTWDLTAVLYAIRGSRGYFSVSEPGTVTVNDDGQTVFEASANGRHRYLIVDDLQRTKTLEALIELSSQPPGRIDSVYR